ncbi:S8 family serine peptidase [Marinihelvus fidelis]|uniref:S8 family serine peptidase n=1 Tax=Marinihelvus fidelis TaxID=2613842 RepID=A0A5N0TGE3_9GAMM|nr:S8 family serine peptidase [Marinihelvus fidelis]KAA9133197.1 S8 family serine peptidase [Marinihelvus fidelis]
MKQRKLVMALATAIATAGLVPATVAAAGNGQDVDRVMVKFKKGAKARVKDKVGKAKGHIHKELDRNDIISASLSVDEIEALKQDADVVAVEIDAPRYLMSDTVPWGITRVQAAEAIAAGADGSGIKVCVIDSGIYAGHEDFAGVTITGEANEGQAWNTDACTHGTHVAGTIAAAANDTGVVGVSPDGNVSLHIVKTFSGEQCDWTYASDLIAAAEKCQEAGADIINMSLGGDYASTFERDAFDKLYAEGVLSIAAAGNDWNTSYNYPASYDSVVSVAAIDENNAHAQFSQHNDQVELAAPGVAVLSTISTRYSLLEVAGDRIESQPFRGTMEGQASGELVDGGICDAINGDWAGKVVLCQRSPGTFTQFWTMHNNVAASGGAAVIIYNNVSGYINGWFGVGNTSTIPALSLSLETGLDLVAGHLGENTVVSSAYELDVSEYGYKDGTSMASPHVAGVAALVWSAAPEKTNRDVRQALGATAIDIDDAGYDIRTGWGLVQAADAAAELANGTPGPVAGSAPSFLIASSEWTKSHKLRTEFFWTAGEANVDVILNDKVVLGGIANTGAAVHEDTPVGDGTWIYKVCNTGTNVCSRATTVNFDGRDVPPNNNGKFSTDAGRAMVLAGGESDEVQPKTASAPKGDTYVSWLEAGGKFDVYLQRIDRKGRGQWGDGIMVADRNLGYTTDYGLSADTEGNALVAYRINDENGIAQLYVQKISPSGDKLWGDEGRLLTDWPVHTLSPSIVGTTDGGAVLAWGDNNSKVWMQKLDADGNMMWAENLQMNGRGAYADYYSMGKADLQASSDGSAIISMVSQLGRAVSQYWAQKVDADGNLVWGADHVDVLADSYEGMPRGGWPVFVADDQGGALFCWHSTFGAGGTNVRAQRLGADGALAFGTNGVLVSTDDSHFRDEASCSYDAETGTSYVGWAERNSGNSAFGIRAQALDATGNRLWGDTGREIIPNGPGGKGALRALPADNGVIFAWGLNERPAPMYLQATRLDADGGFNWSEEIISFKTAPSWMSAPTSHVDDDGRAYFFWSEYITYDNDDLMMQSFNENGRLGK